MVAAAGQELYDLLMDQPNKAGRFRRRPVDSPPDGMRNDFIIRGGIAIVELTQGRSMRVVEEALPTLAPYRWCVCRNRHTFYAVTSIRRAGGRRTALAAHRLLTGLDFGDPREVDHFDGDGLNNLPDNLRVTDGTGNQYNHHGKSRYRDGRAPTSMFPGVHWDKVHGKWQARIRFTGRRICLGYYDNEAAAVAAYLRAKAVRDTGGTEAEIRATRRIR